MTENKKNSNLILLGLVLILLTGLALGAYLSFSDSKPPRILDTYGNTEVDTVDEKGNPIVLKTIHKVPDFQFINQDGQVVTQETLAGKTYVADFFFTTCESICPIMSKEIMKLAKLLKNDPDFVFLSHTVDPETDSVPQLRAYAKAHQAETSQWHFLTGDKKSLYEMARQGYFVTATEGDGGAEDFVHTQNFVLVDKYRHIRGYYDGTDSLEMGKLLKDIELLKAEYKWREGGGQ